MDNEPRLSRESEGEKLWVFKTGECMHKFHALLIISQVSSHSWQTTWMWVSTTSVVHQSNCPQHKGPGCSGEICWSYHHGNGHWEAKGCHQGKEVTWGPRWWSQKIAVTCPSTAIAIAIAHTSHNHLGLQISVVNWAAYLLREEILMLASDTENSELKLKQSTTGLTKESGQVDLYWSGETRKENTIRQQHKNINRKHQWKSKTQKEAAPISVVVAKTGCIMLSKKDCAEIISERSRHSQMWDVDRRQKKMKAPNRWTKPW